jgi:hypothetical protein
MANAPGSPFHGEFSSADASGLTEPNARFTLYGPGGTTALTLDPNDYVEIADITVSSAGTNLTLTIYDGANNTVAGGETIWKGVMPTNNGRDADLSVPHVCQKGTYPKVLTSGAGQVDVLIHGTIFRIGS